MQAKSAPAVLTRPLFARYQVGCDALGWRIEIGNDHAVRPDEHGNISHWLHAEGVDPNLVRRDIELLRALIRYTFDVHERHVFRAPFGTQRQIALEAICDAANEVLHAGELDRWIGRDQ